jgi:glucokinase
MAKVQPKLQFPILIGDIGGTNARFQILKDSYAEPTTFDSLLTKDYKTIEEAIQKGVLDKTALLPRSAILAAAGNIIDERIDMTNCHWVINPTALIKEFTFDEIILLNDFEAQALAIKAIDDDEILPLGAEYNDETNDSNNGNPFGNAIILGPGTGLGVASLIYTHGTWIPVSGEGGHVDLGPRTDRDLQIWAALDVLDNRISAEDILCGSGLHRLYRTICKVEGADIALRNEKEVTEAAINGDDPLAIETCELFCNYLGRVAGDMALIVNATGGAYITGGVGQRLESFLQRPNFREAFQNKHPHQEHLAQIPTNLIKASDAALKGLAHYARTSALYGVDISNRHWNSDNL